MAYQGAIFDVDGVLVDSPHELAWREALKELLEGDWCEIRERTSWTAERFTTQVYQQVLAGKPRLAGARAALEYFGVPDADWRTEQYAAVEHEHVVQFIEQGRFRAFADALRFILAVKERDSRGGRILIQKRQAVPRSDSTRHLHRRTTPQLWLRS
jgi:phosphoglycolate phosphatase-like HAD superfamily hydrolase